MSKRSNSRRQFLKASCAAAVSLGGLSATQVTQADDADVKITEDDPTAEALGYKHDASEIDIEKYPKRASEEGKTQFCDNCALFLTKGENEWAPCSLFQNKLVAPKGWCAAWVAKS